MPRVLKFREITPRGVFHAALVQHRGAAGSSGPLHSHDFWEAMYVLEGSGEHQLGEERRPLQAGQLLLIRPSDCHAIRSRQGSRLLYVNVAFPASTWRAFCEVAGVEGSFSAWSQALTPPTLALAGPDAEKCAELFHEALHAFTGGPTRLDLCRFFSELLRQLSERALPRPEGHVTHPIWFKRALAAMEAPENLRTGLPRLRELCRVSPAYLARKFKQELGVSPTEYLNELRLRRAALLLRTTALEVIDVAQECGFENLSYFYRLFRTRYGCPPKAFRRMVGEQIAPTTR